jgi:hypothetical protein
VTFGFSDRAVSRKARWAINLEARWPPCPTGSREPSRPTRSSHLTAADSLISYGRAAARRLISPLHRVNHAVKSLANTALPSPAGLRPANRLNQNLPNSGIPIRFEPKAVRSSQRLRHLAGQLTFRPIQLRRWLRWYDYAHDPSLTCFMRRDELVLWGDA